jgi:hypothetical protein
MYIEAEQTAIYTFRPWSYESVDQCPYCSKSIINILLIIHETNQSIIRVRAKPEAKLVKSIAEPTNKPA